MVTNMHTLNHKNQPSFLVDLLKLHPERAPTDKLIERWKEGGQKVCLLKINQKKKRENVCVCFCVCVHACVTDEKKLYTTNTANLSRAVKTMKFKQNMKWKKCLDTVVILLFK